MTEQIETKETMQMYQIRESLAKIEEALTSESKQLPTLLRDIHIKLKEDPEIVTILTEEELATFFKGLKKHTGKEISV